MVAAAAARVGKSVLHLDWYVFILTQIKEQIRDSVAIFYSQTLCINCVITLSLLFCFSNNHYGSQWASFSLSALQEWQAKYGAPQTVHTNQPQDTKG